MTAATWWALLAVLLGALGAMGWCWWRRSGQKLAGVFGATTVEELLTEDTREMLELHRRRERESQERRTQGVFGRRAWGKIYDEIDDERRRAHAKHGATSMEATPVDDMNRLAILLEEVGEVAFEFNEARHASRRIDVMKLRTELIQIAAVATAWADACSQDDDREKPAATPMPGPGRLIVDP